MKSILLITGLFFGMVACSQQSNTEKESQTKAIDAVDASATEDIDNSFGEKVSREGAVPAHTLPALMRKQDSLNIKLIGKVVEVCQKKGCWMTIDLENGDTLRVTFRDYGFFVPKDAFGKQAIIKGTAKREVTTVERLRHYAEDAGKSEQEINAISTPQEELVFLADGVFFEAK